MKSPKSKNKVNPEKEEPKDRTDLNLEEMGADQYDYGMGGPGAGRDDSSTRSTDNDEQQPEDDGSD
jgi:hypothetical protein